MKVNPVRVEKMPLSQLTIGEIFTFNGVKFIKLAELDEMEAVPVLTLHAVKLVEVISADNVSVEQKAFSEFVKFSQKMKHDDMVSCALPDTDDFRKYKNSIMPHYNSYINECWYVDNGENDDMFSGEFFYIDRFADVHKGKTGHEIPMNTFDKLGVRILCSIEPCANVFVDM